MGGGPGRHRLNKLYAYTLATGARDTAKEFALELRQRRVPAGIWSDGTTIWVGDSADRKLYAYTLKGQNKGTRQTAKEFELDGISGIPTDLWSDGTTMWAAEYYGGKLYAYNLATGTRETDKEFPLPPNPSPVVYPAGFWSDGTTMWVVDYNNGKVYAYHMYQSVPSKPGQAPDPVLTAGSITLTGATLTLSDYTRAWWHNSDYGAAGCTRVSAGTDTDSLAKLTQGTSYTFHAYSASGCAETRKIASVSFTTGVPGERTTDKDFDLDGNNYTPRGSWSDGTTLWVADNYQDKVYAYTLSSGASDTSKNITLNSANGDPSGVWSDGTTLWVSDSGDDKVYAYTLSDGARDTAKEFNLASSSWNQATQDNGNSRGMWSDGTTLWVGDLTDKRLYAYTLAGGARDRDKEFALHAANAYPYDYWSDGTTLWVLDNGALTEKLYAYTLSRPASAT